MQSIEVSYPMTLIEP